MHYLRFALAAEPVRHDPTRTLDDGIVRALWMTPAELQAGRDRQRSPLVWQGVADFLSGQRHPLSLLGQVSCPRRERLSPCPAPSLTPWPRCCCAMPGIGKKSCRERM